jgi:5-methyltetrahydropteroyltriglutamate--homocysteine methyltransferase
MRTSSDHILTSHAGSLPRPDALIEANRAREAGEVPDESGYDGVLRQSVADIVRHQRELGIDVPGDGELGKATTQRINY